MTWPPAPSPLGKQLDLVGFGEALVLLQPATGETLANASHLGVHVAGAELNACAAVAVVGGRATLCTRLGVDPFAERVRADAQRLRVGLAAAEDPRRPTGVFFKDVHDDGLRRVHYYRAGSAASVMAAGDADRGLALRPRSVLVSGLTVALGPGPTQLVEQVARGAGRQGCAFVLDVNLRPQLGHLDNTVAVLHSLLARVDLLVVGTDEAHALFGTSRPQEIADAARSAGCKEVVTTAGPEGCWWTDHTGRAHHQPAPATHVVDPVGAGDAFTGAYLAARLAGSPPAHAATAGSRLAAHVVASTGDTAGLPPLSVGRLVLDPPPADTSAGGDLEDAAPPRPAEERNL